MLRAFPRFNSIQLKTSEVLITKSIQKYEKNMRESFCFWQTTITKNNNHVETLPASALLLRFNLTGQYILCPTGKD